MSESICTQCEKVTLKLYVPLKRKKKHISRLFLKIYCGNDIGGNC